MSLLEKIIPRGVPIACVFPECGTTWVFDMTKELAVISDARRKQGWTYQEALVTGEGLVWGWACNDPSNHRTEERTGV